MSRALLCAATLAASAALPVQALTVVQLPGNFDGTVASDLAFNDVCAGGTGNAFACEQALFQFRGGDGATGSAAENELKIVDVTPNGSAQFTNRQAQFTHVDGAPQAFALSFDPNGQALSMTFGGTSLSGTETLAGFETLVLRVRGGSKGGLAMTGMTINGQSIPDMVVAQAATDSREYLTLTGFDDTAPFLFTGFATFTFPTATTRPKSSVIFEAKFTDIQVPPVPVPAAGLLLLGALGGMAALRRRRTVPAG